MSLWFRSTDTKHVFTNCTHLRCQPQPPVISGGVLWRQHCPLKSNLLISLSHVRMKQDLHLTPQPIRLQRIHGSATTALGRPTAGMLSRSSIIMRYQKDVDGGAGALEAVARLAALGGRSSGCGAAGR